MELIPCISMMTQLFVLREITSLPQENKKQDRGKWRKYSGTQLNSLKELLSAYGRQRSTFVLFPNTVLESKIIYLDEKKQADEPLDTRIFSSELSIEHCYNLLTCKLYET